MSFVKNVSHLIYKVRINMDEVLVKCEKLDHFGRGLSHILGKIIFVPNLLPNE